MLDDFQSIGEVFGFDTVCVCDAKPVEVWCRGLKN